ncbi:MAG: hypothetical protein E6234_05960 [Sutterella wadsworthensis]|nr:hypothetical protein [Sutterella wadsworthensis]DAV25625.1 MAG TPA: hypothetical protein [Caudoviricetes sp.]
MAITLLLFGLAPIALVLGYLAYCAYTATLKVRAVEKILDKFMFVVTEEEKVTVTKALEEIVQGK